MNALSRYIQLLGGGTPLTRAFHGFNMRTLHGKRRLNYLMDVLFRGKQGQAYADDLKKVYLARIGTAAGLGAAGVGASMAIPDSTDVKTAAYERGFTDKCAELGVDADALVKRALFTELLTKAYQAQGGLARAAAPGWAYSSSDPNWDPGPGYRPKAPAPKPAPGDPKIWGSATAGGSSSVAQYGRAVRDRTMGQLAEVHE